MNAQRVELNDLSGKETKIKNELAEAHGSFSERTGVSEWHAIQGVRDHVISG